LDADCILTDENKESEDRLTRALADYDASTGQVSTNNRYISFGLVAVTYTVLSSDAEIAKRLVASHGGLVLLVGAVGCLGVIFDYLHYMCAVHTADLAIRNTVPGHEHQYNEHWPSYICRTWFYRLRTGAALLGAVLLIASILLSWQSVTGNPGHSDKLEASPSNR
jgi:hypothetical protein